MNIEDLKNGYWKHFSDLYQDERKTGNKKEFYRNVVDYNGEEEIILACTQRGDLTSYQQQKEVNKWCDFFINEQTNIKKIWITTRISQKIFDAICQQEQIEGVWIKWGAYKDIASIENLTNLQYLHLGGGAQIDNLNAIKALKKLKAFETKSLYKIKDYSFLQELSELEDLSLSGDPFSALKKINIQSLDFLNYLPNIVRLDLCMMKLEDEDYKPILNLPKLKYLHLPNDKSLEKDSHLFSKFLK